MSFVSGLLQDFHDHQLIRSLHEQPQIPPPMASPRSARAARRLLVLQAELVRLGVLAATAASIANHMARRPQAAAVPAAANWLQPRLSDRARATAQAIDADLQSYEVSPLLDDLATRLAIAHQLARALAGPAEPAAMAGLASVEALADALRRVCDAILELEAALATRLADHDPQPSPPNHARTRDLLRLAASGATPCLDQDGKLSIPGWAERRADPRVSINQRATLHLADSAYPIRIANASRRGLCITFSGRPPIGARLTIELDDGRTLDGRVQWTSHGRVGLALTAALAADDPLLCPQASSADAASAAFAMA